MTTLPFSATTSVASRLFPGFLWRTLLMWSEELDRACAAAHRYEELRIRQGTDVPLRDRGATAGQVFLEMYADPCIREFADVAPKQGATG